MSSPLARLQQLSVYKATGILVPLEPPPKEPLMDIEQQLKTTVCDVFRQRQRQAELEAANDPNAKGDVLLWRACVKAASNGRMPLVVGTHIVPSLPAGLDAVQRAACQAGLTEIISSNHPEG